MTKLPDEQESKCHSICKRCVIKLRREITNVVHILPPTYPASSHVKLDICSIFMKYSDVKHSNIPFTSAI